MALLNPTHCLLFRYHGGSHWFAPQNAYDHAKVIVGNTEVGIEMTLGKRHYPVLIGAMHVPELNEVR